MLLGYHVTCHAIPFSCHSALHSLSPQTKELLHIKDRDDESADSGGNSRLVRWYHRYKILRGVLDGPEALSMLPFECNLDALNYVSFSKGCYIGQELMARTKFKVRIYICMCSCLSVCLHRERTAGIDVMVRTTHPRTTGSRSQAITTVHLFRWRRSHRRLAARGAVRGLR